MGIQASSSGANQKHSNDETPQRSNKKACNGPSLSQVLKKIKHRVELQRKENGKVAYYNSLRDVEVNVLELEYLGHLEKLLELPQVFTNRPLQDKLAKVLEQLFEVDQENEKIEQPTKDDGTPSLEDTIQQLSDEPLIHVLEQFVSVAQLEQQAVPRSGGVYLVLADAAELFLPKAKILEACLVSCLQEFIKR